MKKLLLAGALMTGLLLNSPETSAYYQDKVTPNEEVNYLVQRGVLEGEGNFNEKNLLTRSEYAEWVVKALKLESVNGSKKFKDVNYNTPEGNYIQIATEHGIINGYPDNTFKPNNTLTRGQMVLLLQRAYKLQNSGKSKVFSDVKQGELLNSINTLSSNGVVNGYANGSFKPNNKVTKQHGSMFLSRADKVYNGKLGLYLSEGVHFQLNKSGNFVAFKKNKDYGGYVSGHVDTGKDIAFNSYYTNNFLFKLDGVKTLKMTNAYALHESLVGIIKPNDYNNHSGEYRVGVDIEAGTYSLVASSETSSGYFAVHSKFEGVGYDSELIKQSSLFKINEVVQVENGDILVVHNASMMKIN